MWLLSCYHCRCESLKLTMCGAPSLLLSAAWCTRITVTALQIINAAHTTTPKHLCLLQCMPIMSKQEKYVSAVMLQDKVEGALFCYYMTKLWVYYAMIARYLSSENILPIGITRPILHHNIPTHKKVPVRGKKIVFT